MEQATESWACGYDYAVRETVGRVQQAVADGVPLERALESILSAAWDYTLALIRRDGTEDDDVPLAA